MAEDSREEQAEDAPRKRILVVDDEEAVRVFLKRALEHKGYDLTCVADGHAALRALQNAQNNGPYDLMISDILMPEIDGVTLALKASDACPDMGIMLISGYSDQRERAYNLEELIDGVMAKPFTMDLLGAEVKRILAKKAAEKAGDKS